MLDQQTRDIIRSTVPVLEEYGEAITKRFYQNMFREHEELLNIFNHSNQHKGEQQKALANMVYAAAKHIDNLEAVMPAVKQVGYKHVSLGVKPEHYPIVGKNLLRAIQEVLGEAATPEILQAWAKAYQVIADVFIGVEQEMYQQARQQEGGWEGFRSFVVKRKAAESDNVCSFDLYPEDGGPLSGFKPGQYISVKVHKDGFDHLRQYSLCNLPGEGFYRIGVKEEAGGSAPAGIVSTMLHREIKEGDKLLASPPAGEFVLREQSDRPVLLLAAGIGITPLLSMLKRLAQSGRQATIVHAVISGKFHPFAEEVARIARQHEHISSFVCYEHPDSDDQSKSAYDWQGRINEERLKTVLPDQGADVYLCGPLPFMEEMSRKLQKLGQPADRIYYEVFGPTQAYQVVAI